MSLRGFSADNEPAGIKDWRFLLTAYGYLNLAETSCAFEVDYFLPKYRAISAILSIFMSRSHRSQLLFFALGVISYSFQSVLNEALCLQEPC